MYMYYTVDTCIQWVFIRPLINEAKVLMFDIFPL